MTRPDGRRRTPDGELVDDVEDQGDEVARARRRREASSATVSASRPERDPSETRAPADFRALVERARIRARARQERQHERQEEPHR